MASLEMKKYDFNLNIAQRIEDTFYAKEMWPVVYVLSDSGIKKAYVGETTDALSRLQTHLKTKSKAKLKEAHLISSDKFNKSATLDIESNLIKYLSADGQYKLINGNLGLVDHSYYQREEVYWDIFKDIWNKMKAAGLARHSLEHINNTDLFKYSPYKTLNKEQRQGLEDIIDQLLSNGDKSIIVEGGAGTGKSILAIFLFKLIKTDLEDFSFAEFGDEDSKFFYKVKQLKQMYPNPKMALVVPMSSFRETLQRVFRQINGLKSSMVVGPTEVVKGKYDIVLVDEAHRLRKRTNLGAYFGAFDKANKRLGLDKHVGNELAWVEMQATKKIYFYDKGQSIKPSDVDQADFENLEKRTNCEKVQLKSQFRARGGNGYVKFLDDLLSLSIESGNVFKHKDYEFKLFNSIENFVKAIKEKDGDFGLCRMVAGYSWKWQSNKEGKPDFDIEIDDLRLKWNSVAKDWINSINAANEVGCIHTTQGYDLNYTGIIFGNEIVYNPDTDKIEIRKENYYDANGQNGINDPEVLKQYILNIYKTVMLRGIRGTYLYVCNSALREYLSQRMEIADGKQRVEEKNDEPKIECVSNPIPFVNAIPLYDLRAAAGAFSELQSVKDTDWIVPPDDIRLTDNLFACQVIGESMNKIIPNGSICIFKKYAGGSRDGLIVLCEHESFESSESGSAYTVKEYSSKKEDVEGSWRHTKIVLIPRSTSDSFQPLILEENEVEDFRVIGIFERLM